MGHEREGSCGISFILAHVAFMPITKEASNPTISTMGLHMDIAYCLYLCCLYGGLEGFVGNDQVKKFKMVLVRILLFLYRTHGIPTMKSNGLAHEGKYWESPTSQITRVIGFDMAVYICLNLPLHDILHAIRANRSNSKRNNQALKKKIICHQKCDDQYPPDASRFW